MEQSQGGGIQALVMEDGFSKLAENFQILSPSWTTAGWPQSLPANLIPWPGSGRRKRRQQQGGGRRGHGPREGDAARQEQGHGKDRSAWTDSSSAARMWSRTRPGELAHVPRSWVGTGRLAGLGDGENQSLHPIWWLSLAEMLSLQGRFLSSTAWP